MKLFLFHSSWKINKVTTEQICELCEFKLFSMSVFCIQHTHTNIIHKTHAMITVFALHGKIKENNLFSKYFNQIVFAFFFVLLFHPFENLTKTVRTNHFRNGANFECEYELTICYCHRPNLVRFTNNWTSIFELLASTATFYQQTLHKHDKQY